MIRLIDSCSWGNGTVAPIKYQSSGFQSNFAPGRFGGFAYAFTNAGFGQIVMGKIFSNQNAWYDSRSFQVYQHRTSESIVWRYADGATNVASVTLDSMGNLRIYQGGDGHSSFGVLVYVSQGVLAVGAWHSIDIAWSFPSTGTGSVSLYIDDALDAPTGHAVSAQGIAWGGVPDRFAMCWSVLGTNGYLVSDIVVNDGSGSKNNSRLGPVRVAIYTPCADRRSQWTAHTAATVTGQFQCVNDLPGFTLPGDPGGACPDMDYSYIGATAINQLDLFSLGRYVGSTLTPGLDCYAAILGVALSVCVREPSGLAQSLAVWPNPSAGGSYTVLASPAVPASYAIVQAIGETNPASGGIWTDGDIANAWWGMVSGAGAPRVTQIVLEKATTLRNVPYNCGQLGSYAVGKRGNT